MLHCAQILAWSAWAPGLSESADWLAAAGRPSFGLLEGEFAAPGAAEPKAPAAGIPAMLRRRLSPLGRAAAQAAEPLLAAAQDPGLPWVYASRWGDLKLAESLVRDISAGLPASPAQFSTSVHNAPIALLSIALGHTGNATALAGGPTSLEAAFESAAALLADHPQVLVVCADMKPPESAAAPGVTWAVGFLLGRQNETENPEAWRRECARGPFVALTTRPLEPGESPDPRLDSIAGAPMALEVLAWLLASDERVLTHLDRHAAQVWGKRGRLAAAER